MQGYTDNYYVRTLTEDTAYPALKGAEEADVCIIGGGLAGVNAALGLVERGKSVIVLEARRIGWGASGRNAGFVAKGYAAGEENLAKKLGLEKARRLVSLTKSARPLIRKRIAELRIDCGPVLDGALHASWKDNDAALQAIVRQANEDFALGFEFWPRERVRAQCKTERYYGAIYSPNDFHFSPLKYVRGLAKAVAARGGKIFEGSAAVKIEKDGAGWAVATAAGRVRAQHVIVSGSIYMEGVDRRIENASFPVRTYMMATAPVDPAVLKTAIDTTHAVSDTRFCSDYYRLLPGNRIQWGGRVSLWAHEGDVAAAMLGDIFKVYPQLRGHVEPEVAWSCNMCYAPHKMPQIGQLAPGYWYNTGFGGHGICPTTAAGEVIAAAIAEGDKTYEEFSPFSLSYAGGKAGRYAAQMVYLWWRARDYLSL
jgi:gamma-glutamylputrescine oxidase